MESYFFKQKTKGKIEGHEHKSKWMEKIIYEFGYTKTFFIVIYGDLRDL